MNLKIRLPLQVHVTTLLLFTVLTVSAAIGGMAYVMSVNSLEAQARDAAQRVSREVQLVLQSLLNPALSAVKIVSRTSIGGATSLGNRLEHLGLFVEVLEGSPILSSLYVGYATGDFFSVRRLSNDATRLEHVPSNAEFLVESIERNGTNVRDRSLYFDANLRLLAEQVGERPTAFDPRVRDWYTKALSSGSPITTTPYVFYSTREVGTTVATHTVNGGAVVGVDVKLNETDQALQREKITPNTLLALINTNGQIVASDTGGELSQFRNSGPTEQGLVLPRLENSASPLLVALAKPVTAMKGDAPYYARMRVDDVDWRVSIVPMTFSELPAALLISAVPERELLAESYRLLSLSIWVTIAFVVLTIPAAILIARRVSAALHRLNQDAERVLQFDFSTPLDIESTILEVDGVARTMGLMKQTIHRFLDVSRAVSSEENFDRLLPLLLRETIAVAQACGGVLYLSNGEHFVPTAALCDGNDALSGLPSVPLETFGEMNGPAVRTYEIAGEGISELVRQVLGLGAILDTTSSSHAIVAPLVNRHQQLLGAIFLLRMTPATDAQISFMRALTDSAAVSLEARELIKSQKDMFEAFIQLLAAAIDAKSPYTGAHCRRVPELTNMLVRAACSESSGSYADFQLSEPEWEAVHLAAWLHDCGKVVTPVHVVDKATKLQALNDRIHEVRTRFEVLRRDAEIEYLRAIASGKNARSAQDHLDAQNKRLDEDFAFIANCNLGGEFMSLEKIEQLQKIASRTWLRTFDNRLGLSTEEAQRSASCSSPPLPATEYLLADKDEHKIKRNDSDRIGNDGLKRFSTPEPALLYNYGEIYNLSIARGTLTEEERYVINQHIMQTILMLSALPFPKHLRTVPDIAGGHHEKMDGTGYPRGLTRQELSPVTRMIAIADIFEALTAVDRPYKSGKTLSEAIKIMYFMKKEGHIDPELFDLFLRSGVYREFAELHLKPGQIDFVDIEKYVG